MGTFILCEASLIGQCLVILFHLICFKFYILHFQPKGPGGNLQLEANKAHKQ